MHQQLQAIVAQLDAARDHLRVVAEKISPGRWVVRADPNRWSVGECVVHLNLTSAAYIPLIRAALDHPSTGPSHGRAYRRDFIGLMLGYAVGPMPRFLRRRMKFKTPSGFVPAGDAPKDVAIAEFDRLQETLKALTRESDGRAIDKVLIASPFDKRASYSVYSALTIIPRHQERHLIQAEEVWAGV